MQREVLVGPLSRCLDQFPVAKPARRWCRPPAAGAGVGLAHADAFLLSKGRSWSAVSFRCLTLAASALWLSRYLSSSALLLSACWVSVETDAASPSMSALSRSR